MSDRLVFGPCLTSVTMCSLDLSPNIDRVFKMDHVRHFMIMITSTFTIELSYVQFPYHPQVCVCKWILSRIQSSWTNTIFHEVNTMGHIMHDAPLPWQDATNSYARKTDSRYQTMHPLCWLLPFLAIVYHQIHFYKTGNENVGAFSQIYGLVIQIHLKTSHIHTHHSLLGN